MSKSIPKGVFDILPEEPQPAYFWRSSHLWLYLETVIRNLVSQYYYKEIRTPIFEHTELFKRSVGEGSDIVTKEMYTFTDKGKRSLTLRPEGTAAVMRAILSNKLHKKEKYYYLGPMFRYERPQAGRYRQHHQFGVEAVGSDAPEQDVEVIDMLHSLYNRLGIKNISVLLNSVGDQQCREEYKKSLHSYLEPHRSNLSEESQNRFEKNILRILDSKNRKDQEILKNAPSLIDSLNPSSKERLTHVEALLKKLNIDYRIEPNLVRGLDYYNHTVFEIVSEDLGAQNALGAGGRYDELSTLLGGNHLPAVGFATGLERILQVMIKQKCPLPQPLSPLAYLIPLGKEALLSCFKLAHTLRTAKLSTEIEYKEVKLQKALHRASELKASFALIIGEEEIKTDQITIKNLNQRTEEKVPFDAIINYLSKTK